MNNYTALHTQDISYGEYSIVPIRMEDRYAIMKWRNEQMYHLRQSEKLTKDTQDAYYKNTVSALFKDKEPSQILFSYLKGETCIGYGGLVHINWTDKNAEISFVMNTQLEKQEFEFHWVTYLKMIEQVAFEDLNLHKIFTYAFDLRPHLYTAVEKAGFSKEATLEEHCFFDGDYKDVIIHSKKKLQIEYRKASSSDVDIYFKWVNDKDTRLNAFNQATIELKDHQSWFSKKLISKNTHFFIFRIGDTPIGQVRFDLEENNWIIDYSLDTTQRGKGLGYYLLKMGIKALKEHLGKGYIHSVVGKVRLENKASIAVFRKLKFEEQNNDAIITFKTQIHG